MMANQESLDQAGTQYLNAAMRFSETQQARNFEAGNEFATDLHRLGRVLRENEKGRLFLESLLRHQDPYVRTWAAKDCLFFNPEVAASVLKEIEMLPGLVGTAARMTLSEWKAGRLAVR